MSQSESRNYQIKRFLKENGPSRFNEIWKHLEREKLGYAKTKALAKKLNTLVKRHKIKRKNKNAASPFPLYSVVENSDLNFAIAGDNFGFELGNPFFWNRGDVKLYPKDSYESKFIKITVVRFGFYVLASLVKNLDYWIKINGKKNDLRKIWLEHALDLSKYQKSIFDGFLHHLFEDSILEENIQENKKIIIERINKVKKSMEQLYPKSYKKLIHDYETLWERDLTLPDRLRDDPGYLKYIPKDN